MTEIDINQISISKGSHSPESGEYCALELVAKMSGEPHSDHPRTVSPIITTFVLNWNDDLPSDAERERLLRPLLPLLIGTRSNEATELRRSHMAFDWLVRISLPTWLELTPALRPYAAALRPLPEITCAQHIDAVQPKIAAAWAAARAEARAAAWAAARAAARDAAGDAGDAVRDAARDAVRAAARDAAWAAAARDAARDAVRDAAWAAAARDAARAAAWATAWDAGDAARAAAGDVARDAVRAAAARAAAWDAVRAAAWDAAWAAAWDAAWAAARAAAGAAARAVAGDAARDAAGAALQPTVERLQASALELVHRMIEARA